jgi:hypothetical protein
MYRTVQLITLPRLLKYIKLVNSQHWSGGMLLPVEPEFDTRNPKYSIQNRRLHPQNRLTIECRICPVIRTGDGALHPALCSRQQETHRRTSGLKHRDGHVAYLLVSADALQSLDSQLSTYQYLRR